MQDKQNKVINNKWIKVRKKEITEVNSSTYNNNINNDNVNNNIDYNDND